MPSPSAGKSRSSATNYTQSESKVKLGDKRFNDTRFPCRITRAGVSVPDTAAVAIRAVHLGVGTEVKILHVRDRQTHLRHDRFRRPGQR